METPEKLKPSRSTVSRIVLIFMLLVIAALSLRSYFRTNSKMFPALIDLAYAEPRTVEIRNASNEDVTEEFLERARRWHEWGNYRAIRNYVDENEFQIYTSKMPELD